MPTQFELPSIQAVFGSCPSTIGSARPSPLPHVSPPPVPPLPPFPARAELPALPPLVLSPDCPPSPPSSSSSLLCFESNSVHCDVRRPVRSKQGKSSRTERMRQPFSLDFVNHSQAPGSPALGLSVIC